MKKYLLLCVIILFVSKASAQLEPNFLGSAYSNGGDCYVITSNVQTQLGAVWYNNTIDFNADFEIIFDANFGANDDLGADGIALVMKSTPTLEAGVAGGGLGYDGIDSSIAVEFDTYENSERSDLSADHIALISNGNTFHDQPTNLAGPVNAHPTSINIEDDQFHEIKISWVAATQTFSVVFDCDERISYTGDLVNNVFGGESNIYFGFTGSTGLYYNLHQVCFKYLSFADSQDLLDQEICSGGTLSTVDATYNGSVSYQWTPATGVSDTTIPNPTFSPTTTTNYTVEITDSCGEIVNKSFELVVNELAIDNITPVNSSICEGEDAEFVITGTPDAEITYNINGGTDQIVQLDGSGTVSISILGVVTDQTITITFIEDTLGLGCTMNITESSTITINQAPDASFSYTTTCDGGVATIQGDAGGVFSFNPDPGDGALIDSDTGLITNAQPNTAYTVEYIIQNPCFNSSTQTITTLGVDNPSFTLTPVMCGATAEITGDQGGSFSFDVIPTDGAQIDANTGEVSSGTIGNTYQVTYTTNGACPQTETNTVTIQTCLIPEVITPNNDGLNDSFNLSGFGVNSIEIYNRFGTKVFHKSDGYTNEFSGVSKDGKKLSTGTYFYAIIFQNNTTKTGWLYINREQ